MQIIVMLIIDQYTQLNSVCVCVCVCVREREREREGGGGGGGTNNVDRLW